jgi:hypothetical protein
METPNVDETIYHVHPVYFRYAADSEGNILDVPRNRMIKMRTIYNGYKKVTIFGKGKYVTCFVHKFIYECHNDIVPDGGIIVHKDNDRSNNNIENLQYSGDCRKSDVNKDYSYVKDNHKNRKEVIATCINTGEIKYFNSLYSVQKGLGINAGLVKMCCDGARYAHSAKSKVDGNSYKFEYKKELT